MRKLVTIICVFVSLTAQAQTDLFQNTPVAFKIAPSQFLVGEKALITELKFSQKYSSELKLDWFKGPKMGNSAWDVRNTYASGFVSQLGIKNI